MAIIILRYHGGAGAVLRLDHFVVSSRLSEPWLSIIAWCHAYQGDNEL